MRQLQSKRANKLVLISITLIVVFFVLIYSNYRMKNNPSVPNNNQLFIKYDDVNIIEIENKLPVADALGKKFNGEGTEEGVQGYLEFSVKNTTDKKVKYDVLGTKLATEVKQINDNYIKIYLTNEENSPLNGFDLNTVPVFHSFSNDKSNATTKVLYTGVLSGNDSETIKVHMWLSDNYRISNNSEAFKIDIDVRAK